MQIHTIEGDIEYKIKHVMPQLLPNQKALIYGKETKTEHEGQKCAILIGLIFSGVSAIGGLLIKGLHLSVTIRKVRQWQGP